MSSYKLPMSNFRLICNLSYCLIWRSRAESSPSGQNPLPTWVNVLAHLHAIISFAVRTLDIPFAGSRQLVVVQFDAQPRLFRDAHATTHNGHSTAKDDFVAGRLPRIMSIAGVSQVRTCRSDVSHRHQGDCQVS